MAGMKATFIALLAVLLCVGAGCGKKEPELRSEKVITPDEAANELFVEAVEMVSEAQSKETTDIPAAIKSYEQALFQVRGILNKYKKSDLAVKLVSGEALFTGKSLAQIEERVKKLKAEEQRIEVGMRRLGLENTIVYKAICERLKKPTGELTKADLEKVKDLSLYNNQLTDVKGLEKLTQLTTLELGENQLRDVKGLEKLAQLEYLSLNKNPALTKAQIDQLKKALPKCKIESNFDLPMLEHGGYVNSVTFSRDGKWVVSGSYDGTIGIRDAESGKQICLLKDTEGFYSAVAISPDGKRIVSGSDDRKVKIWDAESGKKLKTLSGHRGEVFSVALDGNASRIVSGSGDGTIRIWDAKSGEGIRTLRGHGDEVKSVAFSPDGKRVVSGGEDDTAKVWDAESGKLLTTFKGHTSTVKSVAFIHGGKRILSSGTDSRIKIWDAESGEVLKDFKGVAGFIFCVAMSPDGKRIVYGCGMGEVVVMEAESGKVLDKYEEHELAVMSVAISADSKRFVSGGADYHTYMHTFKMRKRDDDPEKK